MKTKWFLVCAIALFTGFSFVACSDDDDPIIPQFPEKSAGNTVNANETKKLSFKANMDWTLSANKPWITFMEGDKEIGISTSGPASNENISVTIKVKDTGWGFEDDTDEITLSMGGEKKVIFEITRPAKAREVTMYTISQDRDGNYQVDPIENVSLSFQRDDFSADKKSSTTLTIGFKANYDWKINAVSEGFILEKTLSGEANTELDAANEEMKATIKVAEDKIADPLQGEITITDKNGENPQIFAIQYEGMLEKDIYFEGINCQPYTGLTYSKEGKFTLQTGKEADAQLQVLAKGMGYRYVFMKSVDGKLVEEENPWINVEDKNGNLTLSCQANSGGDRELIMYLFHRDMDNWEDFLMDENDLVSKYGFRITQKGESLSTVNFFVGWGFMQKPVDPTKIIKFTDYAKFDDMRPSELDPRLPENTYVYEFSNADRNMSLTIAPLDSPNENPSEYLNYTCENWPDFFIDGGYVESLDKAGITLYPNETEEERRVIFFFYDNKDDMDYHRIAPRAIIVIQRP